MSLADTLAKKSDEIINTKYSIINEIVSDFEDYINNEHFEKYIERNIGKNSLSKREHLFCGKFWEYHSGCSGTHFELLGWKWVNPDVPQYEFNSRYYKGITLRDVQKEVFDEINNITVRRLRGLGFFVSVSTTRNNLDYIEDKITIKW